MLRHACAFCKIVGILAIIGTLNWGLVGVANINLIENILCAEPIALRVVYTLIGLSGIALLISFFTRCSKCKKAK